MVRIGFAATLGLVLTLISLPAAGRSRTALVIGNADYTISTPLRNAVNDARDVAAALREKNFDVTYLENAGQQQMESAIREFGRTLRRDRGDALFYYAGHGIERKGRNFLVPIGADVQDAEDLKYKAVNVNQVMDHMNATKDGVNIIILDACRNNPYQNRFRGLSVKGLAPMTGPTGSIIAFATAPGEVAADGDGRNGVFTKHLLDAIREPGITVEETFQLVRRAVVEETGGRQVPWSNSSVIGDFYFTQPGAAAPGRRRPAALPGRRRPAPARVAPRDFEIRPDGVVLDKRSELLWYCPDEDETYTHKAAKRRAMDLSLEPGWGWRLPSENEVEFLASADTSPVDLFRSLDGDPYVKYWLSEWNRWLAEASAVGFSRDRATIEKSAATDRYRACFVHAR